MINSFIMNRGKTLEEALPELKKIAQELGIKLNNGKVLIEYFKRHPNESCNMQKVQSFLVDHRELKPGIYMTEINGSFTYDLRFVAPKDAVQRKLFMSPKVAHTLEHFLAFYFRSSRHEGLANSVVYVGPMGCLTGFYLVLNLPLKETVIKEFLLEACNSILAAEEIPGASEICCGNYEFFDLDGTKDFIVDTIIPNFNVENLCTSYPLIEKS